MTEHADDLQEERVSDKVTDPREFRERWPSIAQIPCVGDVLDALSELQHRNFEDVTALRLMLREFVDNDDGECRYDHEDFCQEHYCGKPCRLERARRLLETT